MKKILKGKLNNILYPMLSLSLFIMIWAIGARAVGMSIVLPSPAHTADKLFILMGQSSFYKSVAGTLSRSLISFLYSFSAAIILSLIASFIKPIARILDPIILFFRATPTMSIILMTLIWMNSSTGPIFIAFLITFPILYANFYTAFSNVSYELIEMSRVYKVPLTHRIFKIYAPLSLPYILGSVKSCISLSLKVLIAAEVMAQTRNSMGFYMQRSMVYLEMGELIAWTVAAIVISYILEYSVELFKRILIRWKD